MWMTSFLFFFLFLLLFFLSPSISYFFVPWDRYTHIRFSFCLLAHRACTAHLCEGHTALYARWLSVSHGRPWLAAERRLSLLYVLLCFHSISCFCIFCDMYLFWFVMFLFHNDVFCLPCLAAERRLSLRFYIVLMLVFNYHYNIKYFACVACIVSINSNSTYTKILIFIHSFFFLRVHSACAALFFLYCTCVSFQLPLYY